MFNVRPPDHVVGEGRPQTKSLFPMAASVELHSLKPEDVLSVLNLDQPGLEKAKSAAERGERIAALSALREHYRRRFPKPAVPSQVSDKTIQSAEAVSRHVFSFLGYAPQHYPDPIDWEWDPRGDIEWVACMYRFNWANALADAYEATGDERYVQAFVDLASDWISKHPLEQHERTHRTLTHWRGFAWLDIQTGIRAANICYCFPKLIHAFCFTPEFLGILLASLYDHQIKSELMPMPIYHNKALMELNGYAQIAAMCPEFRDAPHWLQVCQERLYDKLQGQVTADGVQKEWSFGYHCHVLSDTVNVMKVLEGAGLSVSDELKMRLRLMYEFLFGWATPELATPMFGDTRREPADEVAREERMLYRALMQGAELFDEPKWRAQAKLELDQLPRQTSYAWREAGLYMMRNEWGPQQIMFAFHDSPPAISGHDQDDNGTFELYAYGRWLMTDSGYYTYGYDAAGRAWHRQTAVHQTLTLNGANSKTLATHRLWVSGPDFDAVCVDNAAYPGLIHRRTVWFPGRRFLVILDEAIGEVKGQIDLHYQLAPGEYKLDPATKSACTSFPDANVLVCLAPAIAVILEEEEGWSGWDYNKRVKRPAFRYRAKDGGAPAAFVTLLVPYRGVEPPRVARASLPADFVAGSGSAEIVIELDGARWTVGYDLATKRAWCKTE